MPRARTTLALTAAAVICVAGLAVPSTASAEQAMAARAAQAETAETLPIRRISLYRSGVGSFERRGLVSGDATVRLSVKTEQINDLLKSLVALDLDGGRIGTVTYDSKEPLSRRLGSFAIDLSDNPSVADILARLRGAEVRVDALGRANVGRVLGVEYREQYHPSGVVEDMSFVTLRTSTGMRTVAVRDIESFELMDESLAAELNRALDALSEFRADTVKTIEIEASGRGERRLALSYVQETPIWKTSYRLVLPPRSEGEGADMTGRLQGWAIVENTTNEDWTDIRLSLVSGRPVSFTMDLYEPLFMRRQEQPVPVAGAAAPRIYEGAIERGRAGLAGAGAGQSLFEEGKRRGMVAQRMDNAAADELEMTELNYARMRAKAPDRAESTRLGTPLSRLGEGAAATGDASVELFQYQMATPVTIERRTSAMLPIIGDAVTCQRLSIFQAFQRSKHPMKGARILNETGLQILPGPIAVYDEDSYVGDAQVGYVSDGDGAMIAYAEDIEVTITQERENNSTVQSVTIVNGTLRRKMTEYASLSFTIDSDDASNARTVLIEAPKMSGYELKPVDNAKHLDPTPSAERFELTLAPNQTEKLELEYSRVRHDTLAIDSIDERTIISYNTRGALSDEVLAALTELSKQRAAIGELNVSLQAMRNRVSEITRDQSRVRDNLTSVRQGSALYDRYIAKLTEQEDELERLDQTMSELEHQVALKEAELRAAIAGLNVR